MLILAVETHRHKSIGTFLRCASAFGATTVVVVGSPMYSTHGAHGAQNHVQVVHFYYWNECIDFCREQGCKIYAISPHALTDADCARQSESVDSFLFEGYEHACFIVGEKDGLTTEHLTIADSVLHVSIPVPSYADKIVYDSKVAICLQQFAVSTAMTPRGFLNEKHVLGDVNFRRPKTIKAGRNKARAGESSADSNIHQDPGLEEPLDSLFS